MSGSIIGSPTTPWHLWVVGSLASLWNAGGMFAWYSLMLGDPQTMGMTPEMIAYFDSYPIWALTAYTMGTWGAFFGSLALLARSKWAAVLFVIAILGLAGTTLHEIVLSPPPASLQSTGQLLFTIAIWVVTVALLFYARGMIAKGTLR